MSALDKLKERVKTIPKDLTFEEATRLLCALGFEQDNKGKTSGSRVRFIRRSDGNAINLHKPHPGSIMKQYAVRDFVERLKEWGEL